MIHTKRFLNSCFNFFIPLLIIAFLTGCITNPIIVEKVKTVFIEPAPTLTENCKIEAPISKEVYLSLDYQKKEAALAELNRKNYKNLGDCYNQLTGLRK